MKRQQKPQCKAQSFHEVVPQGGRGTPPIRDRVLIAR
jgi:hypothetical protein